MNVFVARQPIVDTRQQVYAYELLFRDGFTNAFPKVDLTEASTQVISNSAMILGFESLTGGKKAFINVTRDVLLSDLVMALSPKVTTVELLESIEADEEVIAACKRLKKAGYLIALDDFVWREEQTPLVAAADIIKIDVMETPESAWGGLASLALRAGAIPLAEKVETREVFETTQRLGFSLFQGYFFCRPFIVSAREIPRRKISYLQLLAEINQPELEFDRLENIVKRDPSMVVKILRYINSATFGLSAPIESIRQALAYLGEREVRRWASLVAVGVLMEDQPAPLIAQSILRGRFAELIAGACGRRAQADEHFLLGVLSLLEAMLGRPVEELLAGLPVAPAIREGLIDGAGPLAPVHALTTAWEAADWERITWKAPDLGLTLESLPALYAEALGWSDEKCGLILG